MLMFKLGIDINNILRSEEVEEKVSLKIVRISQIRKYDDQRKKSKRVELVTFVRRKKVLLFISKWSRPINDPETRMLFVTVFTKVMNINALPV